MGSVIRIGSVHRVLRVVQFENPASNGMRSVRSVEEFDCAEERYRIIEMTFHTGPMGTGKIVESVRPEIFWSYVPPSSSDGRIMERICR